LTSCWPAKKASVDARKLYSKLPSENDLHIRFTAWGVNYRTHSLTMQLIWKIYCTHWIYHWSKDLNCTCLCKNPHQNKHLTLTTGSISVNWHGTYLNSQQIGCLINQETDSDDTRHPLISVSTSKITAFHFILNHGVVPSQTCLGQENQR